MMTLEIMFCGTILKKLIQLYYNSGDIRTNIDTNLGCLPHWRKSSSGSDCDLVIFATRLYVDICSGYF